MERSFNINSTRQEIDKRNQAQASRSFGGVPGISDLFFKEQNTYTVRFLTPFSLGVSFLVHQVKLGQNDFSTYLCDKMFSQDTLSHCPICEFEYNNPDQKNSKQREIKNFLIYVYDKQGKSYQSNDGSVKPQNVVNIFKIGPGKDYANWKSIESIASLFNLSGVDIEIVRAGTGLQTTYSFKPKPVQQAPAQPGGPITQAGTVFNWDLVPQEVKGVLPAWMPEPGILDPFNNDHNIILNSWGDFFIKAGGYKMASEFDVNRVQSMNQTGGFYPQQPAQGQYAPPQQGGYQTQPMTGQPVYPYQQPGTGQFTPPQQTGIQPGVNPWE